jgi:hypothetical protein
VTEANTEWTTGNTDLTDAANFLSTGDVTDAATDHALAEALTSVVPDEILIVGQLESLIDMLPVS